MRRIDPIKREEPVRIHLTGMSMKKSFALWLTNNTIQASCDRILTVL